MPLTFPSSPTLNQIYTAGRVKYRWNGESWVTIDSFKRQDSPVRNTFYFVAAGGETSLSGNDDLGNSLVYNPTFVSVYLNGVRLRKGVDYTATTGTTITGLPILNTNDSVTIESYDYPYYEQTQDRTEYRYLATASQTVFSGADENANTLDYDPGAIEVYVNGVKLTDLDYTGTNGTSVTLASAASLGDDVVIVAYTAFNPSNAFLKSGGVVSGPITLPGNPTNPLEATPKQYVDANFQPLDADTAKLDLNQTWTGSQRSAFVVDNDGSFDMNLGQMFRCTPASAFTLEFTNEADGQSGVIILTNSGPHACTLGAEVVASANAVTTLSAAGTFWISYISDGTSVWITVSEELV